MGNLADLGLGDIFQIVSLSRRSGSLQLTTAVETAEIVFRQGDVVAVHRPNERRTVGEELMAAGIIAPTHYQDLLQAEHKGTSAVEILATLNVSGEVLGETLEALLKRQVYSMFDWDDGNFSFVLGDIEDPWRGFSLDEGRIVVERGVSPQFLAMEGARLRDERSKSDALEAFLARDRKTVEPVAHGQGLEVERLARRLRTEGEHEEDAVEAPEAEIDFSSTAQEAQEDFERVAGGTATVPDRPGAIVEPPSGLDAMAPPAEPVGPPDVVPDAVAEPSSDRVIPFPSTRARSAPSAVSVASQVPTTVAEPQRSGHLLLLVDDDPEVVRMLADALGQHFAQIVQATSVGEAFGCLRDLHENKGIVVATDLIIARSDGRGILGGIEILETVRRQAPETPVVLFTDYQNVEAEQRAQTLGVDAFLIKPRGAQLYVPGSKKEPSQATNDFVHALTDVLAPYVEAAPPATTPEAGAPVHQPETIQSAPTEESSGESFDLRGEIVALLGDMDLRAESDGEAMPPLPDREGALANLRSMLAELADPSNRDNVTLLVLRFAAEVVERAALFLATRSTYVGLGGFSHDERTEMFARRVRRMRVPTDIDSVFAQVTKFGTVVRGVLEDCPGNRMLLDGLSSTPRAAWGEPDGVAIPLMTGGRVAAIVYGDNPTNEPVGTTEALEIFVQQAGLAMDRALLERQLEDREGEETD